MIVNAKETRIVASFGRYGNLRFYDVDKRREHTLSIGNESTVLMAYGGKEGLIVTLETASQSQLFELSARAIADPTEVLARIHVDGSSYKFEGDDKCWLSLPKYYYAFPNLITIENGTALSVDNLDKADYTSVNLRGEGFVGATPVPNTEFVLLSQVHDSNLVLYDPHKGKMLRTISLAERHSHPNVFFHPSGNEFWATDYDTVVRVEVEGWSKTGEFRIEFGDGRFDRRFIGYIAFRQDGEFCAVARPYSHDAVVMNAKSFTVVGRVELAGAPYDLALLSSGEIIAAWYPPHPWLTGSFTFPTS